jgi:hypothetical protein
MSNLLEITGQDIAQLDDAQLRELIGLLCEADYRQAGLPTKGISWGGHQDAPDGGLDVVVRDVVQPPENSFIPRSSTGFQVKKPDMPKPKIISEMKPKGELRNCIKQLINENGGYIIACSGANTTGTALKDRIDAMKDAVAEADNNDNIEVDFLDRGRIATWVRSHPFLILWVRIKIGRQIEEWQSYESWSNPKAGIDDEYLIDDRLRLKAGTTSKEGMTIKDGIQNLRSELSFPGVSVRLAGLSGVGKTRLVQALFDDRIGDNALNHSLAFYTDISDSPDPSPKHFAEQLIANRTKAVLIVDNCPPDLHSKLTKTCSVPDSTVSLLTVEYDVRDDIPEETNVFRLEPASEELIEKLIRKRFKHISQVDAQTIANFSGGNARIAISLATTVQQGESLSGLRDEDLFKRLFYQRNDPNENLLSSAQVCSLVYSFEGIDTASEKSEIKILASLAGKSTNDLYRDVTTLRKRDLIQSRHVWRAVLPHAIANRLAKLALESIPKDEIVRAFLKSGSERLIKSFSRRLSYLHDCEQAVEIVNEWLLPEGWLGKANCSFNELGITVFKNIAPVSPIKTLEAIENAAYGDDGKTFTSRDNVYYDRFVRLLRHLAYDPDLFDRSVEIMCRFALAEEADENRNSTRSVLKSFFYIHLSGTHATIEDRAKVINGLINSDDVGRQELGSLLLDATLETWDFSSFYDFSFGGRPRDFGYYPKTRDEAIKWFETFIDICGNIALSDKPIGKKAQRIISNKMRGLWSNARMYDVLEKIAVQIHEKNPWNEGWIAVKGIIKYDKKNMEKDIIERIYKLEKFLRPDDLIERARTYALSKTNATFGLEDVYDDDDGVRSGWDEIEKKTTEIGVEVAKNPEVLNTLLPELFTPESSRLWSFGKGLAIEYGDKKRLWGILRSQFEKTDSGKRNISVLLGCLSGIAETDSELHNSILDSLIEDELLGEWFPSFQATTKINQRGVERLNQALDAGYVKIDNYHTLAWGRVHGSINDDDLAELLKNILAKDGGMSVSIDILNMRFFGSRNEDPEYSEHLLEVGRAVLSMYQFSERYGKSRGYDYELAQIANVCLKGEGGIPTAKKICNNYIRNTIEDLIYIHHHSQLFGIIAATQPFVLLDEFLGNDKIVDYMRRRIFDVANDRKDNPLNNISDVDIISWCDADPQNRYPIISKSIQCFKKSDENDEFELRPVFKRILENAPNLGAVLYNLTASFVPSSWSGSRADIMQKRSDVLRILFQHENEEIRALAKNKYAEFQETIKKERAWEEQRESNRRYESFE